MKIFKILRRFSWIIVKSLATIKNIALASSKQILFYKIEFGCGQSQRYDIEEGTQS
jgi:hypothetical protein